jgi:hypothetical protein
VIGLGREGFSEIDEPSAVPATAAQTAPTEGGLDPEEEAISHFARELHEALRLIAALDGDSEDVVGELRQGVLLDVEGRTTETLALLRNAQVTASTRVSELFEHRLQELEERQRALIAQGFAPDIQQDAVRLRAEFAEYPVPKIVDQLTAADRRLSQLELQWQELKNLLRQIDQTRLAGQKVGHEFPEVDQRSAAVRDLLGRGGGVTEEDLRTALDTATGVLRFYHEALVPSLQEELDLHAERLSQFPPGHPLGRRARQAHAEANRHLRNGRLAEAAFRLAELREAIDEFARVKLLAEEGGPTVTPSSEDEGEEVLASLLLRAREIAGRVRQLPPDSEIAEQAAARIRAATNFLRERQLADAARTLTELVRTLDELQIGRGG